MISTISTHRIPVLSWAPDNQFANTFVHKMLKDANDEAINAWRTPLQLALIPNSPAAINPNGSIYITSEKTFAIGTPCAPAMVTKKWAETIVSTFPMVPKKGRFPLSQAVEILGICE